jgi:hypothetical protein
MECDGLVQEIQFDLNSVQLGVCRRALKRVEEALTQQKCDAELLELLADVANNHRFVSIRSLAQGILTKVSTDKTGPESFTHAVRVECPQCHATKEFDKRSLCRESVEIIRGREKLYQVRLFGECSACGRTFEDLVIPLDCKDYR